MILDEEKINEIIKQLNENSLDVLDFAFYYAPALKYNSGYSFKEIVGSKFRKPYLFSFVSPSGALNSLKCFEGDDNVLRTYGKNSLELGKGAKHSVIFFPKGQLTCGNNDTTTFKIWDLRSSECLQTFIGHTASVTCIAFFHDGQIISGSNDTTLKVWDRHSGKSLQTFVGHTASVSCVLVLSDTQFISGSKDGALKIWELGSKHCLRTLKGHTGAVNKILILSNGWIISSSDDKTIRVWDPKSTNCLQMLVRHTAPVNNLITMPNGNVISYSEGKDPAINVWDPFSGTCLYSFQPLGGITSIAVLSNEQFVSGCKDGTLKIWDLPSKRCIETIRGRNSREVTSVVALSDKGRIVIVSASDSRMIKWELNLDPTLNFQSISGIMNVILLPGNRLKRLLLNSLSITQLDFDHILKLIQTHEYLEYLSLPPINWTAAQEIIIENTLQHIKKTKGRTITVDIVSDLDPLPNAADSPNIISPPSSTPVFQSQSKPAPQIESPQLESVSLSSKSLLQTLHDLAHHGLAEELQQRLSQDGGLLEQRNSEGETPLLVAVKFGHVKVVEILLRYGGRLEAKTSKGQTPVALALSEGHQAVIDYLNQHRTVFARDTNGNTVLHKVVLAGQLSEVKKLIQSGAYVNAQNKQGKTALHLAVQKVLPASTEIAKCLMTARADVTILDEKGLMALWGVDDPLNHQPLTTLLIEQRNRVPQPRLKNALAIAQLRYVGNFEHREADRILFDQAFQSLVGKINCRSINALMNTYLLVYLGHLISLSGQYEQVGLKQKIQFEGFYQPYFLALRGRILFEAIVRIQKDQLTGYPGTKEQVLQALTRELAILLETLHSVLTREFIHDYLGDASFALDAQIRHVCHQIHHLRPSEHYQLGAGYQGHTVYASFEKTKQGNIIYRLDNLGWGSHHHVSKKTNYKNKNKKGQAEEYLPYAVCLPASEFAPGNVAPIVKNLLEYRYKSEAEALPLLYLFFYKPQANAVVLDQSQLEQRYPWRRQQTVANCVVKNHQVGFQIRFRDLLLDDEFYRWWREQEPKFLPLKSYLTQSVLVAGYGMVDGNNNPFCSDIQLAEELIEEAKIEGYSELHFFILANNLLTVKYCVEKSDANLDQTTHEGYHALHLALIYERFEILDYLFKQAKEFQIIDKLLSVTTKQGDHFFHLLARQPEAQIHTVLAMLEAHQMSISNLNMMNHQGQMPQDFLLELNFLEVMSEKNSSQVIEEDIKSEIEWVEEVQSQSSLMEENKMLRIALEKMREQQCIMAKRLSMLEEKIQASENIQKFGQELEYKRKERESSLETFTASRPSEKQMPLPSVAEFLNLILLKENARKEVSKDIALQYSSNIL